MNPVILMAVGDAEWNYTDGKLWQLVKRLQEQTGWPIHGITNHIDIAKEGEKLGIKVWVMPFESPGISIKDRLEATEQMIKDTEGILLPGSDLPLWKTLAMDDFVGSLALLNANPPFAPQADLLICPIVCVDNNTRGSSGLYVWLASWAYHNKVPMLGLEISPLGSKQTISHMPFDYYMVKREWSRQFLLGMEFAQPGQVAFFRPEETYLLYPGQDDYPAGYLQKEAEIRHLLGGIQRGAFVVLVPHHVGFIWEIGKILQALGQLDKATVVIRVDPNTLRRSLSEKEIVLKAYDQQLKALNKFVIDEDIGIGLLLQLADLIVSPCPMNVTEKAAQYGKPIIIFQAAGPIGSDNSICWIRDSSDILPRIQSWEEQGIFSRPLLADVVKAIVTEHARCHEKEKGDKPVRVCAAAMEAPLAK